MPRFSIEENRVLLTTMFFKMVNVRKDSIRSRLNAVQ